MMVSAPAPNYATAVTVTIKSRIVSVKGPRGSVTKDFSHVGVELKILKQVSKKRNGNYIRFRMWFGAYKQACAVRTVLTLINNMITGVTEVSHFHASPLISLGSVVLLVLSLSVNLSNNNDRASNTR